MQLKNIKKYLPAIVFTVFIFVIGLYFCFAPKKDYSSNEKRYLEQFPKLSWDTLLSGEFGESFETYLSDHTAGRDFFVGLNSYYDLITGRNGSAGVYSGSDNYLINDPPERENYLESNIKKLADFAKNTQLSAKLLVVPSTGYIMDSKLPINHLAYKDDEYFELIEQNKGGLDFINIKDLFREKSDNTKLYYKTDHHWTARGAYIAYEQYCLAAGITATPESDFNIESYGGFHGTTYSTSALWLTPSEDIELWKNKNHKSNISVKIEDGEKVKENDSLFFLSHLEQDDKYPVYLDGNHALVTIKNENSNGGKLLIIKDSFAHCLTPFLADNYSEIIMVDMRYYKQPVSELVKSNNISDALILYGLDNLSTDSDIRWLK
ncbi:MAG: DHHW family protein [Acutalibacteraceae bacterium]